MHIAVVGMGNVGSALGRRWVEVGEQVTFCVRNPEIPKSARPQARWEQPWRLCGTRRRGMRSY